MSAIKLDGLTLASTANSAVNLDSGVVFPAGHIIQTQILAWQEVPGDVWTSSNVYEDVLGYAASFQTLRSSSQSFLVFELYSGMTHVNSTGGSQADFCLMSSDTSTHSDGNSLSDVTYRNYYEPGASEYEPNTFKAFFKAGTRTTTNLTSYSAGQTLYLRVFAKTLATKWVICHSGANYYLMMQEISL